VVLKDNKSKGGVEVAGVASPLNAAEGAARRWGTLQRAEWHRGKKCGAR
jgi:hypothetical protein